MGKKEKERSSLSIIILFFVILLILVLVVIWFLSNGEETKTTTDFKESDSSSLECRSEKLANGLNLVISPDETEKSEFVIKALFENKELSNISYEFSGIYSSDEEAEGAEAWFRTDYYKYMDKNGINAESLNPVFVNTEKNLKVSLYAKRKNFTSEVAPIFLIDRDEYGSMTGFNPDALKKIYEEKGFVCNIDQ